jgi:hypothetical protein
MSFNAAQNPFLNDFQGGQMTDLPAYPGTVDLTALFEIVSPGTAANGVNYGINTPQLASLLFAGQFSTPTILKTGTSYASVATDTRILSNLTVAAPFTLTMLSSASYSQPILIKDIAGNWGPTNTFTINFSGGQTMDGQASLVFSSPYQWIWLNPLTTGGFYET